MLVPDVEEIVTPTCETLYRVFTFRDSIFEIIQLLVFECKKFNLEAIFFSKLSLTLYVRKTVYYTQYVWTSRIDLSNITGVLCKIIHKFLRFKSGLVLKVMAPLTLNISLFIQLFIKQ